MGADSAPGDHPASYDATPGASGRAATAGQEASGALLRAFNRTRGAVLADGLEVAATFGSRFAGLMGRPSVAPGTGLWLTPGGSIHMLFMRFRIDAVFLGREGPGRARRVVGTRRELRPWIGIAWARGADGVLELPAGTIAATGTAPGDEVVLEPVQGG